VEDNSIFDVSSIREYNDISNRNYDSDAVIAANDG
jgi:hypothetical protein